MANQTVLVLGGGIGGVAVAGALRKRLGREHRIILVEREQRHVFSPSLPWLMVGRRRPEQITRDLGRLPSKGIEVLRADIESIDPQAKAVVAGGQRVTGDYVVVSLGARLAPERVPGLAEAGSNLYTLEGAAAIRDRRAALTSGDLVVLVAGTPFKCPAAPYEAAMLLEDDLRRRGVRGQVSITAYTPEKGPMMVTGPANSAGVRAMLEQRGIAYRPEHQVAAVDPSARTLRFANGVEARYDLLAYVPPHVAPDPIVKAGLTGPSGWVPVDRHTLETSFPGVFAIGDVTGIPLSIGLPLPKAGVFAHGQAEAVARIIAARIDGGPAPDGFDGHGGCFVEVGGGRAAFGQGSFYAEPAPQVRLRPPSRIWHAGKVLFERAWLRRLA